MVRRPHENGAEARWIGALLLATALAFVLAKYLGTVNPWKLTHWLFSYELGFVKRGLVGTLAAATAPDGVVRSERIVMLSLTVAALFTAALAALAWPAFRAPRCRRRALAVGLCALASPGVGFLLSDLGRFDVLNYALCLIAILAARASGRFPYPLFLTLAAAMLLIHEAALLLALPVLLVAQLDASGRLGWLVERAHWPSLVARLAPLGALFALLALFGDVDLSLRELLRRLAGRGDFTPVAQSAYVLIRGLDSNFAQIMGWERQVEGLDGARGPLLGPVQLGSFTMILPVALAQLAFAHVSFRGLAPERRRALVASLYLCFLAPFPLMLFGVDWGRWAALASAHCATLALLFVRELPDESEAPLPGRAMLLTAVFVTVAVTASYKMEGARGGSAESPWANAQRWRQDARGSTPWHRAFVSP